MDKRFSGHLIKAELEEGKVLVQSNMSLQTISAGEAVEGNYYFKEGHTSVKGTLHSKPRENRSACSDYYKCHVCPISWKPLIPYHTGTPKK